MAEDDATPAAEEDLPTKKGNAGMPTLPSPMPATPQDFAPPLSAAALDERQSNINQRRKPGGPPKPDGNAALDDAIETAPDVPETDCDEPPGDIP